MCPSFVHASTINDSDQSTSPSVQQEVSRPCKTAGTAALVFVRQYHRDRARGMGSLGEPAHGPSLALLTCGCELAARQRLEEAIAVREVLRTAVSEVAEQALEFPAASAARKSPLPRARSQMIGMGRFMPGFSGF